jgi:hypothetical protein
MKGRLWYPQLDVYDTARRIALLLAPWREKPPVLERLYIADFYLANPPLLHKTSMPSTVRAEFQNLSIPRPEKTFLSYPAAPILFHKMEPIQKKAFQALIGRGVVDSDASRNGVGKLSTRGEEFVDQELADCTAANEHNLIIFLTTQFAILGDGTKELRRRTGLRRLV